MSERTERRVLFAIIVLCILLIANVFVYLALTAGTAHAIEASRPRDSMVLTGVGAPKTADPVTVADTGSTEIGDGTNAYLYPWGSVVNIGCPALVGTTDRVLACWTMNRGGTVDQFDGQIDDGTRDNNGHCKWISGAQPYVDMRLEKARLFSSTELLPGSIGTLDTIGYCSASAAAAFRGGGCTNATEATDCGGDFCVFSSTSLSPTTVLERISGAVIQLDASVNGTVCLPDHDV